MEVIKDHAPKSIYQRSDYESLPSTTTGRLALGSSFSMGQTLGMKYVAKQSKTTE